MKRTARTLNTYPTKRAGFEMGVDEVSDSISFLLQEAFYLQSASDSTFLFFLDSANRKEPVHAP
jgi:hypothetical protein